MPKSTQTPNVRNHATIVAPVTKTVSSFVGVFHESGALPTGVGKMSGVIALSLGILCFLGVLAFHFRNI